MKITGRRLVSASCSTTLSVPLTLRVFCRCARNSGSYATFLITLDSDGVTWLMMALNTGLRRCVIAVTVIGMLKASSAT